MVTVRDVGHSTQCRPWHSSPVACSGGNLPRQQPNHPQPHVHPSPKGRGLCPYFVSSVTSTSVGAVMGAFECPAVGSSVFSSPLVELITWGETSVSAGQPIGRRLVLSLMPSPTAAAAPGGGTAPPGPAGSTEPSMQAAGGCSAPVLCTPRSSTAQRGLSPPCLQEPMNLPGEGRAGSRLQPAPRHSPEAVLAPRRLCHG